MKNKYILTLDIGGTNPRMAIVEVLGKNDFKIIKIQKIDINESSIINPINNFLEEMGHENITTNTCCISVAGPVFNNSCLKPTNSKFRIYDREIIDGTYLKNVLVINDFEAIGYGISSFNIEDEIKSKKLIQIKSGDVDFNGNRGILGPGTGLGVSYLVKNKDDFIVSSSEGGHVSICEINSKLGLFKFLKKNLDVKQIGVEAIVSGQGIKNIFEFLSYKNKSDENLSILNSFKDSNKDSAKLISESNSRTAKKSMNLFLRYLAIASSDVALSGFATGGIFIAGGICPKNLNLFKDDLFKEYFENNWKQSELLKKIPVYIVSDYDISFYGCAKACVTKLN